MDHLVFCVAPDWEAERMRVALETILGVLSLAVDQAEVADGMFANVELVRVGCLVVFANAIFEHFAIDQH